MKKKTEKGFTLIEIIAVLVILGILTAIAAPRYFSLMEEGRQRAAAGAVTEMQSRIHLRFAQHLLSSGGDCTTAQAVAVVAANIADPGTADRVGDWKFLPAELTPLATTDTTNITTMENVTQGVTIILTPPKILYKPVCS